MISAYMWYTEDTREFALAASDGMCIFTNWTLRTLVSGLASYVYQFDWKLKLGHINEVLQYLTVMGLNIEYII